MEGKYRDGQSLSHCAALALCYPELQWIAEDFALWKQSINIISGKERERRDKRVPTTALYITLDWISFGLATWILAGYRDSLCDSSYRNQSWEESSTHITKVMSILCYKEVSYSGLGVKELLEIFRSVSCFIWDTVKLQTMYWSKNCTIILTEDLFNITVELDTGSSAFIHVNLIYVKLLVM